MYCTCFVSGEYCSTRPFSLRKTGALLGMDAFCLCRLNENGFPSTVTRILSLFPDNLKRTSVVPAETSVSLSTDVLQLNEE